MTTSSPMIQKQAKRNLTITQDDSFVSLFIQLCNTSIVILQQTGCEIDGNLANDAET